MIIEELMIDDLACVAPDEMFSSAVSVMSERALSCVLVTQNGKPEGILTERDVVSFFTENLLSETTTNAYFQDMAIGDVITKKPVCICKSTSLYDALSLAQSRSLRHLLVVDENDSLVGLVTQSDMTKAYLRLLERQKELETENEALYQLSHQDSLMNIGNRRAMTVALDSAEAIAKRYKKTYSVALIDVDFFKKYNDQYGHQAGDDALVAIANAIKSSMRETDQLFRYGGEEILLLLPETDAKDAYFAAERARMSVHEMGLPHKGSTFEKVTISIGVASTQDKSWPHLVTCADEGLYKAKASGRDKVCVAESKDNEDI